MPVRQARDGKNKIIFTLKKAETLSFSGVAFVKLESEKHGLFKFSAINFFQHAPLPASTAV